MGIVSGEQLKQIKQNMVLLDNGEGKEGFVYKCGDLAIKILKHPVYPHQERGFDFLMRLNAKRFVLMKDKLCENNTVQGFTMKYIENKNNEFHSITINKLLSELTLIKQDLLMFQENKVWITDTYANNIMYNGNLYIIDTNSYLPLDVYTELNDGIHTESEMKNIIYQDNLDKINEGLLGFLSSNLDSAKQKSFNETMKDLLGNCYIGDLLKEDTKGCSSLDEYVKKKIG